MTLARSLLLEQDVELVVIKELLGDTHISVTAGVYARPASSARAIDNLGQADDGPAPIA